MRQHIIDQVAAEAFPAARAVIAAGGTRRSLAVAAMRAASSSRAEPTPTEAFEAAAAALRKVYPDDPTVWQELDAISSRNARAALINSGQMTEAVNVELVPMPAEPIGLLDAWNAATSSTVPAAGGR